MAPMVYLQDGIFHAHAMHALLQLAVEHAARGVECLIVDTYGQHEVAEEEVGHIFTPRHLLAGLETGTHILQVKLQRVVGDVGQRHIGIEEAQGLALFCVRQLVDTFSVLCANEFNLFVKGLRYVLRLGGQEHR